MRAIIAKRLRRQVYSKGTHPGPVSYQWGIPHSATKSQKDWVKKALKARAGICIIADPARRAYQAAKKRFFEARKGTI